MRTRFLASIGMAALMAAGASLSGCSSPSANNAGAGTVTWWVPNWDSPVAKDLVADFKKTNPDIDVKMVETTADTMANKISVALDSGSTPDVITELVSRVPQYAAKDQLTDLSGMFNTDMPKDDFLPGSLTPLTNGGSTFGVPYRWDNVALIYNKDLFAKAGITEAPKTVGEFKDDAKKLTSGDVTGTAWPMGNKDNTVLRFFSLASSTQSSPATNDNGVARLSAASTADAVDVIGGSVRDGWASKSSLEIDATGLRQLFVGGQVAMYFGGVYDIVELQKKGMNIGTTVLPGFGGTANSAANGWSYVIPKASKNSESAKKFVQYLTGPKVMAQLTQTFPARISASEDPKFHTELAAPFLEQLSKHSVPAPYDPSWGKQIPAVFSEIQSVALGKTNPEEAAKAIQAASDSAASAK